MSDDLKDGDELQITPKGFLVCFVAFELGRSVSDGERLWDKLVAHVKAQNERNEEHGIPALILDDDGGTCIAVLKAPPPPTP